MFRRIAQASPINQLTAIRSTNRTAPLVADVFRRWKSGEKLTPEKWQNYKNRNVNVSEL